MEQYGDIYALLGLQESQPSSYGNARQFTENTYTESQQNGNFGVKCQNKQLVREDNLFDPSELFDFLSSDECREELNMNDVDYLNNLDFDFNLKELSDPVVKSEQAIPMLPNIVDSAVPSQMSGCDLIDTESDSGIESMNSMSPQDSPGPGQLSSPPPSSSSSSSSPSSPPTQSTTLSLSSIHAMLPDTPLSIKELTNVGVGPGSEDAQNSSYLTADFAILPEYMDTSEMVAVSPLLIKKENPNYNVPPSKKDSIKKPSLLSCLLSIPPVETKSAKQLSSLLNRELSDASKKTKNLSQVDIVNFINSSKVVSEASGYSVSSPNPAFDSFLQKDNGRSETELNVVSVPSLENELMGIKYTVDTDTLVDTAGARETHQRKKLIINKRKKELINLTGVKKNSSSTISQKNISLPWDGDLRITMGSGPSGGGQTQFTKEKQIETYQDQNLVIKAASPTKCKAASNRTYLCPTCGSSFPSSAARSCHRRQVHQRHHLCQTCDRAFTTSQKLERHLRTHKSDKKLKCEVCSKEFSLEENLESHYNVHYGKKLFKCQLCMREYFTRSGLNSHLKQVHSNETQLRCTRCDFVGRTCLELEIHSETEHTETLITSNSQCNQQFIDNGDMLYCPLTTPATFPPSNEKVSKCPVNSVNAEAELQLDIQLKTHNISKKHTCKHCGHKFAFKNSLTKHLSKGRCIILKKTLQQNIQVV